MDGVIRLAVPGDGQALAVIYRPAYVHHDFQKQGIARALLPRDASPAPPRLLGESRGERAFASALAAGVELLPAK